MTVTRLLPLVCALAVSSVLVTGAPPGRLARPFAPPIDRRALVDRHAPDLRVFDRESPLSVGNGSFVFTADVTGLQTFPREYDRTIPLATMAEWGWHTGPNPNGWSIDRFQFAAFASHGRMVPYADVPDDRMTPEIEWLRTNPHRLHLGRVGLVVTHADGSPAAPGDLSGIEQRLDLWNGVLVSRFRVDGQPVEVETVVHPSADVVAARIDSPLLAAGRVGIVLAFPYGTPAMSAADWTRPEAHETELRLAGDGRATFVRTLDADRYLAAARWTGGASLTTVARHEFHLMPRAGSTSLEVSVRFTPAAPTTGVPAFETTRSAARAAWHRFWSTGGAIDLSESTDPRWRELERRIVLSEYLTAIQSAGTMPPAETGLTFNSWYGKVHLEMHWWHAVHFALWDRLPRLERSLGYYDRILARARGTAARQGYRGARWPKMTDPDGRESPSAIGPYLVWQQPHPIYYAELCYRAHPDRAVLERYRAMVFETAEFMASYAARDSTGRYVLGPPLQGAQEVFPKATTVNPTFELAYWRWGLSTAQRWRERLGLARSREWDDVLAHLSSLPVSGGRYLFAESAPDSFTNPRYRRDHPSVLAALGMLPGDGVDRDTMRRTFDWIWDHWNWPDTWGWDYPMLAMSAARLGEPERAVDALLLDTPKNAYRTNGHNHQRDGLTIYLPGNGGLLAAVAMMAGGWDGAPDRPAPGFPANGRWVVRWEHLRRMP